MANRRDWIAFEHPSAFCEDCGDHVQGCGELMDGLCLACRDIASLEIIHEVTHRAARLDFLHIHEE